MAQYARPDGDESVDNWTTSGGSSSDLFEEIDEETANDSDHIEVTDSGTSDEVAIFTLSDVTDPSSSADHKVIYRVQGTDEMESGGPQITVQLLENSTSRASWTRTPSTSAITTYTETLTSTQADSITNYANLKLKVTLNAGAGGDTMYVYQAYFECPDASGGGGGGGGGSSNWPVDISTGTDDDVSFSVNSQDSNPRGLFIGNAGAKLYVIGDTSNKVYQYTLSTPWDISTASYDSKNFSVGSQEYSPGGVFFKDDGAVMYVTGAGSDAIHQYDLSTPWDISTASYDDELDVQDEDVSPTDVFIGNDGTRLYMVGASSDEVHQYTLGSAWDISTSVSYNGSHDVGSEDNTPRGVSFSDDGTQMFVVGSQNDTIYQYALSTGWDISTASYDSKSLSVNAQESFPSAVFFKTDGEKFYVVGMASDAVHQYSVVGSGGDEGPARGGASSGLSGVSALIC